jgi:hypothetical protein
MPNENTSTQLNSLWAELLNNYSDGVSNTSTTKYNAIRDLLSTVLQVPLNEIYATGAKTRTSNLDTRLVQGNQAGRHTKVGVAFMQVESATVDLERLSDSAVVTSRKFVDGSDNTRYDAILIFVESGGGLLLKRVIQSRLSGYFDLLKSHFPEAQLVITGTSGGLAPAAGAMSGSSSSETEGISNLVEKFTSDAAISRLHVDNTIAHRFASCLLSKRFLIATGLAGSGKTKLVQALARWITPTYSVSDPFFPGATLEAARKVYKVNDSDRLGVEFLSDEGTKVLLPRAIIEQWANYIEQNNVSDAIGAQELRDKIKATGGDYSAYLQNFETHYKPAAFSLLKAKKSEVPVQCYEVVPVGADWTGNENILGYPDGLQAAHYVAKPALDLILHAEKHDLVPHFLILDEMNLSHVERYFADVLSIIESDEGLELYSGDMNRPETWRKTSAEKPVPPKLKQLPENLFIIGTVNVDETTYMFSPKVLDRANVIEFRMDAGELAGFLGNPAKPDLSKLDGKGASFGQAFVDAAKNPVAAPAEIKAAYDAEILLFFKTLQSHGAEFGYRTAYETARFIHFYKLLANHTDGDTTWFPGAFDCVVFQKLLPKLHGSRAKLGPVLKKLWFLCVNDAAGRGADALMAAEETKAEPNKDALAGAYYPMSAEKIYRMWRLMMDNGFASFAEA